MDFLPALNQERLLSFLARFVVLLTTMPIHECAHGWMAHKLGDDTAKNLGRLTLNPLKHLDLFGSLLILFVGFGWAKPVPVNPNNFRKNPRAGFALTSLAGPVANLLLALVLMVLYQIFYVVLPLAWGELIISILASMIMVNISLAVFNLLPLPPLDGYNILSYFLPPRAAAFCYRYQRFFFGGLFFLLMFTQVLDVPLRWLANLILQALFDMTVFIQIGLGLVLG